MPHIRHSLYLSAQRISIQRNFVSAKASISRKIHIKPITM